MKIMRGSYLFLILASGVGMSYAVHRFSRKAPQETLYYFSIDPRLSEEEQQSITVALEQERLYEPAHLAAELKKKFPSISHVAVSHSAHDDHLIEINAHTPLVRINDALILCDHGSVLQRSVYREQLLQTIPRITVPTSLHNDNDTTNDTAHDLTVHQLRAFVNNLTPTIYEQFDITWHNVSNATFRDKTKTDLYLMANGVHKPSEKNIQQCQAIYIEMKEQPAKTTTTKNSKNLIPKNAVLVTDIRFEKQIIAYFKRGEGDV